MNVTKIKELLKESDATQVEQYIAYLESITNAKNRDKTLKNPWMKYRKDEWLARVFKAVEADGLVFDGKNITLQSTGVSYNYQAYKNKMLLVYPETIFDVSIVHKNDAVQFGKESGHIKYSHSIADPFNQDEQSIIGAYCVLKNKRGEFLTLLSKKDIDKHRQVAKTQTIWKNWFLEMAMKTIVKKACKQHFNDIFQDIETLDNENYDLEKLEVISAECLSEKQVSEITDLMNSINNFSEEAFLKWVKKDSVELILTQDYEKVKNALVAKQKQGGVS